MSPSPNLIRNSGFEAGGLAPWFTSAPDVATVVYDPDVAPAGNFYLHLETAVGNRGNTLSQHLSNLTAGATYHVSLRAQMDDNGANYCAVSLYGGNNSTTGAIASLLDTPTHWTTVEGSYVARAREDVLHVVGLCNFSGSSYTGHILLDEVVFAEA
ncbi:uncharacterized protein BJX67DRAFT_382361 [Aspergillus lucknowensis]|uniref:CBM-cenC domain-containing protein n=1 Tax=Aspergillus lucknowensis TaxID=176173 RepID=A0ABR4LN58_9EURO